MVSIANLAKTYIALLVMADDHDAVTYSGNWVNGVTEDFDAALQISFFGEEITVRFTIFDREN